MSTYTDLHEMAFSDLAGIGHMVDKYGYAASVEYGMALDRLDYVVNLLAELVDDYGLSSLPDSAVYENGGYSESWFPGFPAGYPAGKYWKVYFYNR